MNSATSPRSRDCYSQWDYASARGPAGLELLGAAISAPFFQRCERTSLPEPVERTASEVAALLGRFINQMGSDEAWREFVERPIANPTLDRLRIRARQIGPSSTAQSRLAMLQIYARATFGAHAGG